jgi:hypothetical protein
MTLYSHDIAQQRQSWKGLSTVLPENFLKSLAKRRRLLVDTGEKTGSTQSGRFETAGNPRCVRESSGA